MGKSFVYILKSADMFAHCIKREEAGPSGLPYISHCVSRTVDELVGGLLNIFSYTDCVSGSW